MEDMLEYRPLVSIDPCDQIFPLTFSIPIWSANESPLLSKNLFSPQKHILPVIGTSSPQNSTKCSQVCRNCCSECLEHSYCGDRMSCSNCCSLSERMSDERNLLRDRSLQRSLQTSRSLPEIGIPQISPLLSRNIEEGEEESWIEDYGYYTMGEATDGFYQDAWPVFFPLLLRGEFLPPILAKLSYQNRYLSRVSQRILRDCVVLHELIQQSSNATQQQGINETQKSRFQLKSLLSCFESMSTTLLTSNAPYQERFVALNLSFSPLDFHHHNSVWTEKRKAMQVMKMLHDEDFVPTAMSHLNPSSNNAVFLNNGSSEDYLLKIFLQQIVFTDHPFMNEEERCANQLLDAFTLYSQQLQHNSLAHSAIRIQYHAQQFQQLISLLREMTSDELTELHQSFLQLVHSLPMLWQQMQELHTLSENVYRLYSDLKTIRRQQSFVTTSLLLRARRFQSNFHSNNIVVSDKEQSAYSHNNSHSHSNSNSNQSGQQSESNLNQSRGNETSKNWQNYKQILNSLATNYLAGSMLIKKLRNVNSSILFQQMTDEYLEKCVSIVESTITQLVSWSPGLYPEFLYQLTFKGVVTAEALLPREELLRRHWVTEKLKYRLTMKINHHIVLQTKDLNVQRVSVSVQNDSSNPFNIQINSNANANANQPSNTSNQSANNNAENANNNSNNSSAVSNMVLSIVNGRFIFDFRRYFEVNVCKIPRDISLELSWKIPWNYTTLFFFSRYFPLATINLPVPTNSLSSSTPYRHIRGYTHQFAPVIGGFQFSSSTLSEDILKHFRPRPTCCNDNDCCETFPSALNTLCRCCAQTNNNNSNVAKANVINATSTIIMVKHTYIH
jgi:hypothetical protein